MADPVTVRVAHDGTAEHDGQTYTFDPALAGAVVTIAQDDSPAASATKAAWVDYAVSKGASREDAEAQTKDALVERYGG